MEKKVEVVLLIVISIFAICLASAESINDLLHLNIQTINSSGDVVTGTFHFEFNISTSSDCANVVYYNFTNLTTDSRGVISYYLENTNLDYSEQYWLCYYRDGTLINASKIARNPYAFRARNISLSGVEVDSDLNLGSYNLTIGGGWLAGGMSILGPDIFARTLYVYNISSLNVNNLFINGSSFPYFDNTFDLGNSTFRWKDLWMTGNLRAGIGNFSGTIYINNATDLSLLGNRSYWNFSSSGITKLFTASPDWNIEANNFVANNGHTIVGYSTIDVPQDTFSLTTLGYTAGYGNRGNRSILIGENAGVDNLGNYLTAVGYVAGSQLDGIQNRGHNVTVIGAFAGRGNLGHRGVGIGVGSLQDNDGHNVTAIGYDSAGDAGFGNQGNNLIAIGVETAMDNSGDNVIAIGYQAARDLNGDTNSGDNSVFIGYQAGIANRLSNIFLLKQTNINPLPLIFGNFTSGTIGIGGNITSPTYSLEIGRNSSRALNVSGILYVNASSDRVGIGTASPDYSLEILNNAKALNVSGILYANSSGIGIGSVSTLGSSWLMEITNNAKALNVSGLLYVNSSNVGIDIPTSSYLLEIANNAKALNVSGILYANSSGIGIGSVSTLGSSWLMEITNNAKALNVSGMLYVNSSNVWIANTITVGNTTPQAYNCFGTSCVANSGQVTNKDDVFIKGTLEVDGGAYLTGGSTTAPGIYWTGADIAENLQTQATRENNFCNGNATCYKESTDDDIDYGDLVCVNRTASHTIMKCREKNSKNAVGFISKTFVLNVGRAKGYPVALAGLVPAHTTNENGEILPGDWLISSSKPGYAMKKGDITGGVVVGIAYDFCDKKDCEITVFVALGISDYVAKEENEKMKQSLCRLGATEWC